MDNGHSFTVLTVHLCPPCPLLSTAWTTPTTPSPRLLTGMTWIMTLWMLIPGSKAQYTGRFSSWYDWLSFWPSAMMMMMSCDWHSTPLINGQIFAPTGCLHKINGCKEAPECHQVVRRDGELRLGDLNLCQSHHPCGDVDHRHMTTGRWWCCCSWRWWWCCCCWWW